MKKIYVKILNLIVAEAYTIYIFTSRPICYYTHYYVKAKIMIVNSEGIFRDRNCDREPACYHDTTLCLIRRRVIQQLLL